MRKVEKCSVCVVGACGFLGSHIVETLINDRQCDVLAIDNLVVGRLDFLHPKAKFVHHDITGSEEYLRKTLSWHNVKYLVNAAAYPYVPTSIARPKHVFEVNATGAINVINAAHEAGCESILQISSAELYGNGSAKVIRKIDENAPVVPHSSYGVSKAAVDGYVQCRWRENKVPAIALRQFNAVGERDVLHPYVIPEIISQLHRQWQNIVGEGWSAAAHPPAMSPVVKLGNNSYRDFIYAGDMARMAVELLEKGEFGEVYNMGSETGIRIYDLAKLIGRLMGFANVQVKEDEARKRPWEIWALLSDNTKIYSVIESRPQVSLEEALRRTIVDLQARQARS